MLQGLDAESSEGTQAGIEHQRPSDPLSSVFKAPRVSLPKHSMNYICMLIQEPHTHREERRKENVKPWA